jgi:pilus assembly protein Flp/PilA
VQQGLLFGCFDGVALAEDLRRSQLSQHQHLGNKMLVRLYCFLSTLKANRKGVTAIEYAMMAALIAVGLITATTTLKNSIVTEFATVGNAL